MVAPLRRRATKRPAQRTSEGRASREMAADTPSFRLVAGFPRPINEIEPFPRDLVKHPGYAWHPTHQNTRRLSSAVSMLPPQR